jgi:hypothetical protein
MKANFVVPPASTRGCAGNGIFQAGDGGPKNAPGETAETAACNKAIRSRANCAAFSTVSEIRRIGRLDGGVCSHMRTGLAWISPENREFFEEFNK